LWEKNVDKPNTSFVEDVQKHNEELHDICSLPNIIQSGHLKEVQKKNSPWDAWRKNTSWDAEQNNDINLPWEIRPDVGHSMGIIHCLAYENL